MTREERAALRAELEAAGLPLPTNRGEARLLAAWRRLRVVAAEAAHSPRWTTEQTRAAWRLARRLDDPAALETAPIRLDGAALMMGPTVVSARAIGRDARLARAVREVEKYDALTPHERRCSCPPPCRCKAGRASGAVYAATLADGRIVRPALWREIDRGEGGSDVLGERDAWREEIDAAIAFVDRELPKGAQRREGTRRRRALAIVERVTGIPADALRAALSAVPPT